jgi:hypothetical protein
MACQRVLRLGERLIRDAFCKSYQSTRLLRHLAKYPLFRAPAVKHNTPSILVEDHTDRPSSPHSGSSTASRTSPTPPPDHKPATGTASAPTSADEKPSAGSGARGGAGLRARMAARQSARDSEARAL